jgi:predicted transcriptional regulator
MLLAHASTFNKFKYMDIKSKNLTISMPSDLFVSLEKSASALDRSKNYLVRKSLEVFLVNNNFYEKPDKKVGEVKTRKKRINKAS